MAESAYILTCPRPSCGSTETEEFGLPIPVTHDDVADCVRCLACGFEWALDPGADASCVRCGGSGDVGGIGGRCSTRCPCLDPAA